MFLTLNNILKEMLDELEHLESDRIEEFKMMLKDLGYKKE